MQLTGKAKSRCRLLTGITTTKRRSIATMMPTANVLPSCPCLALRSQIVTGTADQHGSEPVHNEMNSNTDSYSDNSHQHRIYKIRSQCICIHPRIFAITKISTRFTGSCTHMMVSDALPRNCSSQQSIAMQSMSDDIKPSNAAHSIQNGLLVLASLRLTLSLVNSSNTLSRPSPAIPIAA